MKLEEIEQRADNFLTAEKLEDVENLSYSNLNQTLIQYLTDFHLAMVEEEKFTMIEMEKSYYAGVEEGRNQVYSEEVEKDDYNEIKFIDWFEEFKHFKQEDK